MKTETTDTALSHFRHLLSYDDWANREVLSGLQRVEIAPPKSVKLLAHIIAAERLWLARMKNEHQPLPIWPDFTVRESAAEIAAMPQRWRDFLDSLSPGGLATGISYKNSKGQPWTSSIQDILMHVVMHSAYHRGQIATDMRDSGHEPAYTDFIQAVRTGMIE